MPPKTASNSVRFMLEQNGYSFSKDSNKPNFPQIHLKLSEIVEFYNIDNIQDYKILQITRNPYHRYVSSFFFQKKIVPPNFSVKFMNYTLEQFSKHLSESKKTNNFIDNFYGNSDFVNHTINSGNSWGGTRFYDKQIDWNDLLLNVKYFKLENIINDTTELRNFLNLSFKSLPLINSQNLNLDYQSLITSDIKNIVIELFEEDFDTLGYIK